MIDIARQDLIAILITEIGKRGQSSVAISDLLGQLLSRLRVEMNVEAGLLDKTEEQRSSQKKKQSLHNETGAHHIAMS